MEKIKTFLSGINNMLIFIFKIDKTKWRVLFNNTYFRFIVIRTSHTVVIVPYVEVFLHKTYSPNCGSFLRLFIIINCYHYCIQLSFNNKF